MFYFNKKTEAQESEESGPIDICWVIYIGMKIGYSEEQVRHMYFGKWHDMFMTYQKAHDFGNKKFDNKDEKEVHSLSEL